MPKLKIAVTAIALCAGLGMSGVASAMPVSSLQGIDTGTVQTDQVRLVCNRWGRCWRTGWGAYGWHRGWHRGWRHRW